MTTFIQASAPAAASPCQRPFPLSALRSPLTAFRFPLSAFRSPLSALSSPLTLPPTTTMWLDFPGFGRIWLDLLGLTPFETLIPPQQSPSTLRFPSLCAPRSRFAYSPVPSSFILHPFLYQLGFAWICLDPRTGVQSSRRCPGNSRGAAAGCIHSDSPSAPAKNCSFWSDQVGFAWICLDSTLRRPIQSALPRRLQGRRRGVHSYRFTRRSNQKPLVLVGSGWICLDLLGFNAPASNPVGTAPAAPAAPPRGAFTPIHAAPPAKNCSFWSDQVGFAWICLDRHSGPHATKRPAASRHSPLHPMKDSPPSYFIIQPSSFHP